MMVGYLVGIRYLQLFIGIEHVQIGKNNFVIDITNYLFIPQWNQGSKYQISSLYMMEDFR